MILTDTHAHLYASEFDTDRETMMQRAIDAGVSRLFLPNIDSSSIDGMIALAKKYPNNCCPMIGLHPCSVTADYQQEIDFVEQWLNKKEIKFYAVGEIGLDYYWNTTYTNQQKIAFREQIELAKKHRLPIVIHVRSAFNDTFEIVNECNSTELKGIFHCFGGSVEDAEKIISLGGFKLGIGGVCTFKNSSLNKVIPNIDLEHLVLETDAPYLAPVPHRGKRNESSYINLIAQKIAELKNTTISEVAEVTTKNSIDIFGV
ncbi:MAG: TatD family hydrolase [Bacteroidia bacterium]|nr:TatD family hydrolase [Bacteroidia bacterium]